MYPFFHMVPNDLKIVRVFQTLTAMSGKNLKSGSLVPRATRTSPSKDSTARSDSRSYHEYLDFDWSKDIQI